MVVDDELLKSIASEKNIILFRGMTNYADIEKAIEIFKEAGCSFELMHTVSTYPMKDEDANLMIKALRDKFNCDVGYSGHDRHRFHATAALGITSLERHITWSSHVWF